MADQTCLEHLIQCAGSDKQEHITQDILLNASNEFRNIWNLVKKLQSVARIDVKKITRFLDNVQEGLETKKWEKARTHSVYAEHEYRQIKKYIRASYLEDYKVAKFIDNETPHGNSKHQKDPSVHHRRKQTFRNMQINKQRSIKIESEDSKDNKSPPVHSKTNAENREVSDGQEKINTDNGKKTGGKIKGVVTGKDHSAKIKSLNSAQVGALSSVQVEALTVNDVEKRSVEPSVAMMSEDNTKTTDEQPEQEQDEKVAMHGQFEITNCGNEVHQQVDAVTDSKPKPKEINLHENHNEHNSDKLIDKIQDQIRSLMDVNVLDKIYNNKSEQIDSENGEQVNALQQPVEHSRESENETVLEDKSIQNQPLKDTTQPLTGRMLSPLRQNIAETSQRIETKDECINEPDDKNKTVTRPPVMDTVLITQVSDRLTKISVECNVEEIVKEVAVVFKQDWNKSFKTLTGCEPSNGLKNSISFLGEILKVSAEKVKNTMETRRKTGESYMNDVNNTLCTQKEDFLRAQLRNLRDKFGISNSNAEGTEIINTYAAKCVELAWFMSAQSPPLMFDYDSRPMLLEDLFKLFKPYKNNGKFIQFVVWPAIRRCSTGEVIEKGIAEFR